MKKHAPATLRNSEVIADVLARELPSEGTILEIASGSGEHAVYFAERFPNLTWQPSDPSPEALASILAYRDEFPGLNLCAPIAVDATAPSTWAVDKVDAILCCNMVHISPWEATEGLFIGAEQALISGGKILLYGPYFEAGVEPAPSNVQFDEGLRMRDPRWGIRTLEAVNELAEARGFGLCARYEMPANNLTLVYERS